MLALLRRRGGILLVGLEVQAGGVVKDQVYIRVQQAGDLPEDLLFDGGVPGLQQVHGVVQVVQSEPFSFGKVDLLRQPLLVAVELGAGRQKAVCDHREQGLLQRTWKPP